jgi:hypothetical protein
LSIQHDINTARYVHSSLQILIPCRHLRLFVLLPLLLLLLPRRPRLLLLLLLLLLYRILPPLGFPPAPAPTLAAGREGHRIQACRPSPM